MSCTRMENRMLGYVDGRLKESERLEVEKHLSACAACRLRVKEFGAVSGLLEELPVIEPSAAFDVRVRALVAAEPARKGWWNWFAPSPRVAFAASLLLVATVWLGTQPKPQAPVSTANNASATTEKNVVVIDSDDLPVLENFDVLSNFEALTDLSEASQTDDETQREM
jgi:anti-sigma factor RsiW